MQWVYLEAIFGTGSELNEDKLSIGVRLACSERKKKTRTVKRTEREKKEYGLKE